MSRTKEVLFNDGEGIDYVDFNAMQRFLRAQLCEVYSTLCRPGDAGNSSFAEAGETAYCIALGGAPYASATARKITHLGGWIAQQTGAGGVSAPSGEDPEFLMYMLAEDEAATLTAGATTLAIGGVNPRYDLLCYKLDMVAGGSVTRHYKDAVTGALTSNPTNKERQVRCQMQVVAGTPAGSPVEPSVPSGYVKLCAVYVPAAHNAVIDPANILDYRMPAGTSSETVWGTDAVAGGHFSGADAWTVAPGVTPIITASASADSRVYLRLNGPLNRRLVRVAAYGADTTSGGLPGMRLYENGTANLLRSYSGFLNSGSEGYTEGAVTGGPIWANGRTNFYAHARAGAPVSAGGLAMMIWTNLGAMTLRWGRFIFAGGL